jgi:hypothetical protein
LIGLIYTVILGGIIVALITLLIDAIRREPNPHGMSKTARIILILIPLLIAIAFAAAIYALVFSEPAVGAETNVGNGGQVLHPGGP